MPITISLDPAHHDLDSIHAVLAGTYWSPHIRREVVAEALRNSITAVAHLDGEAGAEGALAGRALTRARLPTSPRAANRGRRSQGAGR